MPSDSRFGVQVTGYLPTHVVARLLTYRQSNSDIRRGGRYRFFKNGAPDGAVEVQQVLRSNGGRIVAFRSAE
jgi:hypothetical protein